MYDNYRFFIMQRIEKNSVKRDTGCIEYAGGKLKHKYGLVSITFNGKRKSVPAHRAYYMAVNNCLDLPREICIRHKCDNPCCVNIEHLVSGTYSDNMRDCIERGRKAKKYKPHTRVRIHSKAKIEAIRNAVGKYKRIAYDFGVTTGYVSKIKSGKLKKCT